MSERLSDHARLLAVAEAGEVDEPKTLFRRGTRLVQIAIKRETSDHPGHPKCDRLVIPGKTGAPVQIQKRTKPHFDVGIVAKRGMDSSDARKSASAAVKQGTQDVHATALNPRVSFAGSPVI